MSAAPWPPSGTDVSEVARGAVARVLGVDVASLRHDTPLASIGWDSLAVVCLLDALDDAGLSSRGVRFARTVGDVVRACSAVPVVGRP